MPWLKFSDSNVNPHSKVSLYLWIQCARIWVHSHSTDRRFFTEVNHGTATDFSAAPACVYRFCSGHQMPALFFYLLHLANVVCCWASTILVNAAHAYGPFLAEEDQFRQPILVLQTNFYPRPKFSWQYSTVTEASSSRIHVWNSHM